MRERLLRGHPYVAHRIFPDWAWLRRPHAYTCPLLLTLVMIWRRWRTGREIHWTGYRKGRGEPLRICAIVRHSDGGWHGVEIGPDLPLWLIFTEFLTWQVTAWVRLWREGRISLPMAARCAVYSVRHEWASRHNVWTWGGRTWRSRV